MNRRDFLKLLGILIAEECCIAKGSTKNLAENPQTLERIIRFPDSSEVFGYISIYDGKCNGRGEYLAKAAGSIKIPAGKNVLFRVDRGIKSLEEALKYLKPDDIQAISLQSCNNLPAAEFKKLAKLTGLKWIDLWYVKNKDLSFAEHLANTETIFLNDAPAHKQLSPLRNLELDQLGVDNTDLDDEDLKDIIGDKGGPKSLAARWNNIKGPGYRYLNPSKRLNDLIIAGNPTDDKGICYLHAPNLERLDANDTFLTDNGVDCIVKNHPGLKELEIGNMDTNRVRITNRSFELVSKLQLKTLNASGTSAIDGAALKYLHTPLEAIYLMDTPLSDADTGLMPESVNWTRWGGTKITDKGMRGFNKYKLKFLDVRGTDVTIDGVKNAKNAFTSDASVFFSDHSKMNFRVPELNFKKVLQKNNGDSTSLEELKGKIVVLESWATWCGFCKYSVPHDNELAGKLANEPVQFIHFTDEKETVVRDFLKENEICGWVGLDPDKSIFDSYRIKGRPTTLVIDRKGHLITRIYWRDLSEWRIREAFNGNYKPLQSQQSDAVYAKVSELLKSH